MSEHIRKSHNVTLLMYHLVFPIKFRKKIFIFVLESSLKSICDDISKRYEILFLEIGTDEDHVHFLLQSVPDLSVTKIVTMLKSIIARELFKLHPDIKKFLWGTSLWSSGYYASTVGRFGSEQAVRKYINGQGKDYKSIFSNQLSLFD